MKYDNRVFNKYFKDISKPFERPLGSIREIIIHGTGGGKNEESIINWMLSGERAAEYKKGIALYHYSIDRDGSVTQIIPDNYFVYHSSSGAHDRVTIGIELLNPYVDNHGGYTDEQYVSLLNLINGLKEKYPITVIAGHGATGNKYSNKPKNCPGEFFDWDIVQNRFNAKKIYDEIYEVAA